MKMWIQGLNDLADVALSGRPFETRRITYGAARNIHAHIEALERDKLRLEDNLRKMKKSVPEGGNSNLVREVGVLTAKNEFLRVDVHDLTEKLKLANAVARRQHREIAQLCEENSRLKNVLDAYNLRDKQAKNGNVGPVYNAGGIATRIESIEKTVARIEDRGPILASSAILIAGITIGVGLSAVIFWIAR